MNETLKEILIKLCDSKDSGESNCVINHSISSDDGREISDALDYAENYGYIEFIGSRSIGFSMCRILPKGESIVKQYHLKD